MKKGRSIWKGARALAVVAVLIAAMLSFAACSCSQQSSSSAPTSSASSSSAEGVVPNLVSLDLADAKKAIVDAGFKVGKIKKEASDTVAEGKVISQQPKANAQAKPGSVVALVVSTGKKKVEEVTVPDLSDCNREEAEQKLADAGLKAKYDGEVESTTVKAGLVVKQSPEAGKTVDEGTEVTFTIAKIPARVKVPDLSGRTKDEAAKLVKDAFLNFKTTEEYSDTVAKGYIISQSPSAGTEVDSKTDVKAVVSLGKEGRQVSVPNVIDLSWSDARSELESAGLEADKRGDSDGIVVSQSFDPGTKVDEGTVVTVTLEKPVETVSVPDLDGLSWEAAKQTLNSVGLKAAKEGNVRSTIVVSQDIDPGTVVDKGTTVTVVLDAPVKMTKVPNVKGKSVETAREMIEAAGLRVGDVDSQHGVVEWQSLPAGDEVAVGTSMDLQIDDSEFR